MSLANCWDVNVLTTESSCRQETSVGDEAAGQVTPPADGPYGFCRQRWLKADSSRSVKLNTRQYTFDPKSEFQNKIKKIGLCFHSNGVLKALLQAHKESIKLKCNEAAFLMIWQHLNEADVKHGAMSASNVQRSINSSEGGFQCGLCSPLRWWWFPKKAASGSSFCMVSTWMQRMELGAQVSTTCGTSLLVVPVTVPDDQPGATVSLSSCPLTPRTTPRWWWVGRLVGQGQGRLPAALLQLEYRESIQRKAIMRSCWSVESAARRAAPAG